MKLPPRCHTASIRQRLKPIVLISCLIMVAGCKNDATSPNASKDSPITGKPTDRPVNLDPTWKVGNRYVMRLERVRNSQLPGFGGRRASGAATNIAMETSYAQEYSLTITNGENGSRGAELEILGIELLVSNGDEQVINYDSQNKVVPRDPSKPMLAALEKLVGGKIRYEFSAENKVLKVEGINALFNRLELPATGDQGERRGGGLATGMLRQAMNEDVFKQMVDVSGGPPSAIKIGDSWPTHRDVNAPLVGKLSINLTNTLRGWQVRDGVKCARVDFNGTLGRASGQRGPFGAQMLVKGGTVTGNYWYDPALGITREMASEQSYTVSGTFPGGRGTNAEPRTVSAPFRETTMVKLIEVKPADQ